MKEDRLLVYINKVTVYSRISLFNDAFISETRRPGQ